MGIVGLRKGPNRDSDKKKTWWSTTALAVTWAYPVAAAREQTANIFTRISHGSRACEVVRNGIQGVMWKNQKPRQNGHFIGVSMVGAVGIEPTTSPV
jgi:hypothetical protein